MRIAERVLAIATSALLVAVIVLCWLIADAPQGFSSTIAEGQSTGREAIPWPLVWAQIASTVVSVCALVGLASSAGLLFLRAARWTGVRPAEEDPTPEPSP